MSFESLTFGLLLLSILLYVISVPFYKSYFNPLGLYAMIWGAIPYLYTLKLSSVLVELSSETYGALFLSFFSFICGCLVVSKKKYFVAQKKYCVVSGQKYYKARKAFFFLFVVCVLEMVIKTPPLFSANPFGTYMEGVGVRFLHFATILIAIPFLIILLSYRVKRSLLFLLFLIPFLLPLIYMQRGLAISFLLSTVIIISSKISLKKQFLCLAFGAFFVLQIMVLVGNFRQSFNSSASSISDVAGMRSDVPEAVMWLYSYTTPSVQNLNQTINNPDVQFRYGYDVIQPITSLLQMKSFDSFLFPNNTLSFDVIDGFNVPTYLNWAYLNFGYAGFCIVPFILALIAQIFFNGASAGQLTYTILYAIWAPNIIYSFHDFLFWNPGVVLSILLVLALTNRLVLKRNKIMIISRHENIT